MIKVLGYGDSVFDDYFEQKIMYPGGNALNFSVYATELGVDSGFLGIFSDDMAGDYLKEITKQRKIDTSMCKTIENSATQTCRIRLNGNDRIFCSDHDFENQVPFIKFDSSLRPYMDSFDLVHVGCYCDAHNDIKDFQLHHACVSYDLSNEGSTLQKEYYSKICPYVDFIIFSSDLSVEHTKELMVEMYQLGCPNIIATRGTKGQIFYNGSFYYGACKKVNAIDTCGAGDSFLTAFLVSALNAGYKKGDILNEKTIKIALEKASDFSSINCMRKGSFGYGKKY